MEDNLQVNTNQDNSYEDTIKMNFFQRLFGVIFSPADTMKCLAEKPRILFGLLLTLITPVVYIFGIFPMYKEYMRSTLEATYAKMNVQMTPQQIDNISNISTITSPVTLILVAAASLFLGTLILWAIVKLFKGEGTYKQYLSVSCYTAVIAAISTIVAIILTHVTGSFSKIGFTNLASLLPDMSGNFLYGMAKGLDLFLIWQYIVIGIGTATISKLSKNKVFVIIGCIFAAILIYYGAQEIYTARVLG
jgi:hypothetical protein